MIRKLFLFLLISTTITKASEPELPKDSIITIRVVNLRTNLQSIVLLNMNEPKKVF